jgi:ankyrin repeat protein
MKHLLLTTIAAVLVVGCGGSIHEAAVEGNIEAVKQHLAGGVDVNVKEDRYGRTPLHYAAKAGHKEIVELLISKGADVNAKNEGGWTPLHYAAFSGCKEVAELLIAKGAEVNAKSGPPDGSTPLDWAIEKNHTETADLIRKHGGEHSIYAARQGNIEAVKEYLDDGKDVNAKNEYGWTHLNHAAEGGHKEIVELLIAAGADLNVERYGETPLDTAIFTRKTEIADLLRKHGGKTGEELKAEGK